MACSNLEPFATGTRNDMPSRIIATTTMTTATRGASTVDQRAQLLLSLVDREETAHAEEQQRHDERPEIAGATVPKGMPRGWRGIRLFPAQKEQDLIAAVGERMTALGQQRGGPGERRRRRTLRR
jgi:hypothetical protein